MLVARKIGALFQEQLGVGALAGDDPPLFDEEALDHLGLTRSDLEEAVERERAEAHRREDLYRQGRPAADLRGCTAIIVDDGLATGFTACASLRRVRRQSPERVVLAVPVCSPRAADLMREEADDVVCLHRPGTFMAVGQWYENSSR